MPNDLIAEVTADDIVLILRTLGWTANASGPRNAPNIASAVNGVNFNVRFGTPSGRGWSDFTIFATFDVDQNVTPVLGASWNRRQRFARVYRTDRQIVLDMDVVVAHGVDHANLRHHFAIWADVTRLFLQHLKVDHEVLARRGARVRPDTTEDSAIAPGHEARRSQLDKRGQFHAAEKLVTAT